MTRLSFLRLWYLTIVGILFDSYSFLFAEDRTNLRDVFLYIDKEIIIKLPSISYLHRGDYFILYSKNEGYIKDSKGNNVHLALSHPEKKYEGAYGIIASSEESLYIDFGEK